MAKYTVHYSCGHPGTVQLVGKESDRERRIEWLEREGLCPDCYKARKDAEHAAENAAAAEANRNLSALEGTPKQVAWAESIRAKALASKGNQVPEHKMPADLAERMKPWGLTAEDAAERMKRLNDGLREVRSRLERQTSAKWWIDNRERVDFKVLDAYRDLDKEIFGDVYERREREKAEAAERKAE